MSKTIEIGPYSAYAIAVKFGYVGTEEDWIKAVEAARKSAETSAANAKREADKALASANTAIERAGIATTKAGESAASADASASSASAAAISEANAKKYSEEAGAKANTDKTLSIENALPTQRLPVMRWRAKQTPLIHMIFPFRLRGGKQTRRLQSTHITLILQQMLRPRLWYLSASTLQAQT